MTVDNEFLKADPLWGGKILFLNREEESWIYDLEKLIRSLFINATRINSISTIQRYLPGDGLGKHVDDANDATVKLGVVIYINDNYDGGEIYYPTLDLAIKPKARSLIIHPASLPHLVQKVQGKETRYTMSIFVRGNDNFSLNEEIINGL
jgi:hypothetical protein